MPDEGRSVASGRSRSTGTPDEGSLVGSGGSFTGVDPPDSCGFAGASLGVCDSPVFGPDMGP